MNESESFILENQVPQSEAATNEPPSPPVQDENYLVPGLSTQTPPPAINEILGTFRGEVLQGTDGDDIIYGFQGRDTLIGGAGNDTLIGGLDGDVLIGGAGSDHFVYDSFGERTDVIVDFNVYEDQLVLTNVFAELNYNGTDPVADGYLQFVPDELDTTKTRVQIDPDGSYGSTPFRTMAVLENVSPEELTIFDTELMVRNVII